MYIPAYVRNYIFIKIISIKNVLSIKKKITNSINSTQFPL